MKTFSIELQTRDGASFSFDCPADRSLLDAAASAQIALPSSCRQGSCGACYGEVCAGDFELSEHNPEALPADAANKNGTLLCRTYARSDMRLKLPFDRARVRFGAIPRREADVLSIVLVGGQTVRLDLRYRPSEDGSAAEFEPGQFVEIEIPGTDLRRAYSLANLTNWEGRLELLIRLQPGGRFSAWLSGQAQPGDSVIVHGPQGAFGLRENGLRPRWFVAGGTGLAPMLSMLRRMAEYQDPQPVRLLFGVNRAEELFCLDELAALQKELPQLETTLCIWKADDDWQGFRGTPVDALVHLLITAKTLPDIYLCGPPGLIDAAEAEARRHGVPAEQVVSEKFLPA